MRKRNAFVALAPLSTSLLVLMTASVAQQPEGDEGWALATTAAVFRFVNLTKDLTKSGTVFRDCPACPQMVVIPPGSFLMGSPESDKDARDNERPQHKVTITKPFAVSRFEVTFAEWNACIGAGGCAHRPSDSGWGQGARPVINVSWDDITTQYLPWLNRVTGQAYRLLT
ncbi:MAG: formylglycine-generating enzyme family protein, partial [Gammaproteobacteria bacterium]|nr:formylglycine-generating enzyme family protein [Gammaproteobacteria bacterium]